MPSMFAVVEFVSTRSVGIISSGWFASESEDVCYYPRTKDSRMVKRLICNQSSPTPSWKSCEVKVLYKTGDIVKAEEKAQKALETSTLETTDSESRKQKSTTRKRSAPSKYLSSDSEMEPDRLSNQRPKQPIRVVDDSSESEVESDTHQGEHQPPAAPWCTASTSDDTLRPVFGIHSTPGRQERAPSQRSQDGLPESENLPAKSSTSRMASSNIPVSADVNELCRLMRRVLMGIEDIKETQRIQGSNIQGLMKQSQADKDINLPDGATASFPLMTMQEFDAMEQKLNDPHFANGLGYYLGDIGGRNLDELIRRMMKFVFRTELATKFNVSGANAKRAFSRTRLFEAVNVGVKKNNTTSACSKKDVEKALGKWFTGCRDRDGNRAVRSARESEQRRLTNLNL